MTKEMKEAERFLDAINSENLEEFEEFQGKSNIQNDNSNYYHKVHESCRVVETFEPDSARSFPFTIDCSKPNEDSLIMVSSPGNSQVSLVAGPKAVINMALWNV
jgi:hypothetical protein